jgi:hypothetical protein
VHPVAAILAESVTGAFAEGVRLCRGMECLSLSFEPGRMATHRHRHLIEAILRAMLAHTGKILLCKCKSHIGIIGNEMADMHAKQAGTGRPLQGCFNKYSEAWRDLQWLWHPVESTDSQPSAVDDLGSALKKHMSKMHALGTANALSYYFQEWARVVPNTCGCLRNGFMLTSTKITWIQRKQVSKGQERSSPHVEHA